MNTRSPKHGDEYRPPEAMSPVGVPAVKVVVYKVRKVRVAIIRADKNAE